MTDFEQVMQFLNTRFPDEANQPFYILQHQGPDIILIFQQDDEWYDTTFVFNADEKLININGVSTV